jgi:hypothetical protein
MIRRLRGFISRLLFGDLDEYFTRFIMPHVERMRAVGIPEHDIDRLVRVALNSTTDPTIVGNAPGNKVALFADLIEAGLTVKQILREDE